MGGQKKLSLKQMERRQLTEKQKTNRKVVSGAKKDSIGIFSPDPRSEVVINDVKKMKVLTPYTIATRFDLRLSVAKHFLKQLEQRGVVDYVSGSKNLKVYKIA